jgi:hypothetical protein
MDNITTRYFSKGDRIMATMDSEHINHPPVMYYKGMIYALEVAEQTFAGLLRVRVVTCLEDVPVLPWFWITCDGKDADGNQLWNFIDVIYAPMVEKTPDVCHTMPETNVINGTPVVLGTGYASTYVREPLTVKGECKETGSVSVGVGAQCDEEVSNIRIYKDGSLGNRIG